VLLSTTSPPFDISQLLAQENQRRQPKKAGKASRRIDYSKVLDGCTIPNSMLGQNKLFEAVFYSC
jgi:hypothetical protein